MPIHIIVLRTQSELMEKVVLATLGTLTADPDVDVRRHGAQILVQFLRSVDPKWGTELLVIGSGILQRGVYLASRAKEEKVRETEGERGKHQLD